MALILSIETSTSILSVALARDGKVLEFKEVDGRNSHSEYITLFIEEVLKLSGVTLNELDAVAVSGGPGSYTGLRIGVSTAKGLCYSKDIPLIAVSTLKSIAFATADKYKDDEKAVFCPMIDARRMEVYAALFDNENNEIREIAADIIDEKSYLEYLDKSRVVFSGDGAAKCKETIIAENALFYDEIKTSARYIAPIAEKCFNEKKFVDVAYFEPFYLKAYIAGKSKVKGLYD
ncbi:MAG: tRNA (adenosine(37)-N6)-threonylcarbamoyltransferase complex dimerization subunit type 1 TsaB [Bacteroidota bacterium]|nr:tRNA (adenosine(37)-N6)-threonylcarbamoyltransferase complex dimerization subunit type 1 TsaB [Bacteroidota bacterium]